MSRSYNRLELQNRYVRRGDNRRPATLGVVGLSVFREAQDPQVREALANFRAKSQAMSGQVRGEGSVYGPALYQLELREFPRMARRGSKIGQLSVAATSDGIYRQARTLRKRLPVQLDKIDAGSVGNQKGPLMTVSAEFTDKSKLAIINERTAIITAAANEAGMDLEETGWHPANKPNISFGQIPRNTPKSDVNRLLDEIAASFHDSNGSIILERATIHDPTTKS